MQANQKSVISTVVIATVLLLIVSAFGFASVNSNLKLVGEKLDGFDVDENAIANAVIANMTIPEYPEFDTETLDELWEGYYSGAITDLETEAQDVAKDQFREDNEGFEYDENKEAYFFYEDDEVYDLVTEDVECDGDCVVEYIKEYDDREVEVINLGLDDEDDRKVELSTVIRVKVFTDEDDDDEYFFEKVYLDSTVTSDDEDLEAEITYSL